MEEKSRVIVYVDGYNLNHSSPGRQEITAMDCREPAKGRRRRLVGEELVPMKVSAMS